MADGLGFNAKLHVVDGGKLELSFNVFEDGRHVVRRMTVVGVKVEDDRTLSAIWHVTKRKDGDK